MNKKTVITIILLVFFGSVFFSDILAWDNTVTHKDLSEFAAETSVLSKSKGDYLKNLGFNNALDEYFQWGNDNKKVRNWLREGAFLEDEGSYSNAVTGKARYTNHFHNPLKSWDSAGLTDLQSGESSLKWAQDSAKQAVSLGGDWSWQKIRLCYYNALTLQRENDRQAFFACTFEGLGYQIHLIQDASQPAHVRNDAHPADGMGGVLGMMEGFETWAKKNYVKINSFASPPAFPMVSLAISYGGYVPITQFIDTDQYYGENPSSSSGLGLSEYTSANFVSDDTIFTEDKGINHKHYFPYPRYSTNSYEMYEAKHSLTTKRIYLRKKGDGESIEHFATAGPLLKFLSFDPVLQKSEFKLDPAVYNDYASLLIPRAVGYSAGLLNYFFRGSIDMVRDTENDACKYVIYNLSNENMEGTFGLYYDDASGNRNNIASGDLTANAGKPSNPVTLDITEDLKNKSNYILVFKGTMGNETGAVVADAKVTPFTSSCGTELTISGANTTSKNSTELYTVDGCTGCSDDVTWEVSGAGAKIETSSDGIELKNSIKLTTDDTACGAITITASCPGCGIDATKTVTISDTLEIIETATPDCYAVKDGTGSYTWSITKGTINENGCTNLTGQCGTATITVTDANGCTGTRDLQLPDSLTITGPDAGKCYTTTGTEPYIWYITKGSIDTKGCVDLTGQCGTATISVTDANKCIGEKELNIPAETLTITGSETTTKNSTKQYTASGCGQVEWSVSPLNKGATINKTTGLLTTDGTACGTFTITASCPSCSTTATKSVRVTDGGSAWVNYAYAQDLQGAYGACYARHGCSAESYTDMFGGFHCVVITGNFKYNILAACMGPGSIPYPPGYSTSGGACCGGGMTDAIRQMWTYRWQCQ